jgi:outer membrane receptor protein involved in Fe transport
MTTSTLLGTWLLLAAGQIDPEPPDESAAAETVVTSTRIPVELGDQPRALSVISEEELARRPTRSTPEALREMTGVFVQKTNHAGGAPILRGLLGQQILILVDGVRLNNATTRAGPNQSLNMIDPFLVEQIEVLRGQGSVLYGSDALGGVINVRTAWPRFSSGPAEPIGLLRAQVGSADGSLQGHLRAGVSLRDSAAMAAVTARDFNELTSPAGIQRYTGYEEGDAAVKVRHRLSPGAQLALQYQAARQRNAPRTDRSFPGDFRNFSLQERDFAHGKFSLHGLGPLREVEIELSALRAFERTERWQVARDRLDREEVSDWTFGARLETEASLRGWLELLAGLEAFQDRISARSFRRPVSTPAGELSELPEARRYPALPTALSVAAFALLRTDPARATSGHAGVRLQNNRTVLPEDDRLAIQFRSAAAPPPVLPASVESSLGVAAELGGRRKLSAGVDLLATATVGFRAPNVDDYLRLGSEGPGFTTPSRGLRPERSYAGELGLRVSRLKLSAELFGAYTVVAGMVAAAPTELGGSATTPDGQRYLRRINADHARLISLETALAYRLLSVLTLSTNVAWTHSEQHREAIVEPVPKAPPLSGVVQLSFDLDEHLFVEAAVRWAAAQRRLSEQDRGDTRICPEAPGCRGSDPWAALFLRAGVRLSPRFSTSFTLQNATNALYRYHGSGVDEPGMSATLAMEAKL